MAAAVTILAQQRRGPKLTCQVLFYPVTDANFATASYQQFAGGPWLTNPAMEWFWDAYAPDPETRKEITAAPFDKPITMTMPRRLTHSRSPSRSLSPHRRGNLMPLD